MLKQGVVSFSQWCIRLLIACWKLIAINSKTKNKPISGKILARRPDPMLSAGRSTPCIDGLAREIIWTGILQMNSNLVGMFALFRPFRKPGARC
jgi:hypothetical protein